MGFQPYEGISAVSWKRVRWSRDGFIPVRMDIIKGMNIYPPQALLPVPLEQ